MQPLSRTCYRGNHYRGPPSPSLLADCPLGRRSWAIHSSNASRRREGVRARTRPVIVPDQPLTVREIGFPFEDGPSPQLNLDGRMVPVETAIAMMAPCILDERLKRIESVLDNRTYTVLPIMENPNDMGNLSACCRTADGLGYGAVHCINTSPFYRQSARTSKGAEKWLDVKVWDDPSKCLSAVRAAGYQVVVTHISPTAIPISEVDFTRPTAIILGNEADGVSPETLAQADVHAIIPMQGFVQSYNVSVAMAIVLYEAQQQRVRKLGRHGDLTAIQRRVLQASLMMKSLRHASTVISELLDRPPPTWQEREVKRFDAASWKYGTGDGEDSS